MEVMKRFAFLLSLIFCLNAAYAFTLDGIVYSDSKSSNTVSVKGFTSDLPADVVIPSEVTYEGTAYTVAAIDSIAFRDCTSLTSIEIPASVMKIAATAFMGCVFLRSVVISDGNEMLTVYGYNFVYGDEHSHVLHVNLFNSSPLKEIYLGRNLSYDYYSPFSNKTELSKLTIGNSVTEIGDYSFYGCESLTSVVLPDSIGKIGKCAFARCSSLTSIKIPDSITTIENFLFAECISLTSIVIPNNVTMIIGSAFWGCTSLKSVTVSDGTDLLTVSGKNSNTDYDYNYPSMDGSEYHLFNGNPLNEVYLGRNMSYDSTFSPFKDKKELTKVTIGNSVTKIGNSAFSGCASLASIIIPNNIMEIDDCAFSDCVLLASVEIPSGVTTIGKAAFSGCAILSSIDIPNRVMTIGDNAFKGCTSLISVNISEAPDTLTISGNDCSLFGDSPLKKVSLGRNLSYRSFHSPFGNRDKLSKVTISDTVTELGDSLFAGCKTLAAIAIPNSVTRIGNSAFAGCNVLTSIAIPDSIKELGNSVFSGCSTLSSITIPGSVTRIGDSTFQECTSLESIVIPGTIKELGNSVFSGCSALSSITIPGGVTRIGDSAFQGCVSLDSIAIPGGVMMIGDSAFQGCVSLDSIAIPGGVMMIGDSAFRGCTSLNSIAIPGSVVMIKDFTFSDCTSLRSVTFFDGNKALEFGHSVFNGTSLNEVYLDRNISGYNFFSPFRNQKELTKVTIGNSVTSIGNYTFEGCSSLTSIELPTSVSKIGSSAFSNCTSLVSIGMHDSVIEIGRATFSGCTSLAFIEIPNSIRRIGDSAFSYCTSLLSITIPGGVMNIGGSIFDGCRSLTSVVISDSEDTLTIEGSTFRFFASCSLNEIYLGRNLSYEMEYSPFHDQNRLSKVTIGECVTDLTSDPFHGCENIRTIVAYHDLNIGSTAFEEEVLYRANIIIKGNKDLVLGISESQWNRFSHIYYEEDSKLYLPVFWNIRLDCPEAFYSKDNGCLVSSDYLVATVYDSSDSNVAVYFRSDNVLESLVSDE